MLMDQPPDQMVHFQWENIISLGQQTVKSNTHNVHSSVTPSAAPQLKCRLHPHEGIKECGDHTIERGT